MCTSFRVILQSILPHYLTMYVIAWFQISWEQNFHQSFQTIFLCAVRFIQSKDQPRSVSVTHLTYQLIFMKKYWRLCSNFVCVDTQATRIKHNQCLKWQHHVKAIQILYVCRSSDERNTTWCVCNSCLTSIVVF